MTRLLWLVVIGGAAALLGEIVAGETVLYLMSKGIL